ncbi:MAG: putative metal-dependent hydrolase [Candidatus Azotimanducaceae bacterium]|jgi:predicted metal-dependent hydrolase
MHDIPVRKMMFDIPTPESFDPKWMANDIIQSYLSTGTSLYVAYLEPFLVKSMRRVLDKITDDKLRGNVERFSRQEAQHYTQHEKFNEAILGKGYPGLQERFDELKQDFDYFLSNKDDKWCVGFVEGFEALTTQLALQSLHELGKRHRKTDPRFAALFEWHMTEEIEHRTVAFDIYEDLYGDYPFRAKMCWVAQSHILKFIIDCMKIMSPTDVARYDQSYHVPNIAYPTIWLRMSPAIMKTMTPWYTPYDYDVPDTIQALSAKLSDDAASVT